MVHYLYIGHFKRDGDFIGFETTSEAKPTRSYPAVQRPLDPEVIQQLLSKWGYTTKTVPVGWQMSLKSGYIAWNRRCGDREATDFIVQLAQKTGCDLADYSSLTFMDVEELSEATQNF